MKSHKRITSLILGVAILLMGFSSAGLAASKELTVAAFGGSFAEMTKKCHIEPFEKKYGVKVNLVPGISSENVAKLRAQRNNPQIDVAYMDRSQGTLARNEGLLAKLDPNKIASLNQLYDKAKFEGYMAAQLFAACGLVYNNKEVKDPPKAWADLWSPRFAGKIALPDISGTAGWMTMLMAARINGGDLKNMDPGFEAVKKLKKNVVTFYTHADQLVSLLERGEAVIAPWYHDRTAFSQKKGLPLSFVFPEEGAVAILPCVVIPKGAPNQELAEKYIDMVLSIEGQKCFAENMFEGAVNKEVELSDELAAKLPYGPKVIEAMVVPDYEYVGQKQGEWTEKFNKEIAQ